MAKRLLFFAVLTLFAACGAGESNTAGPDSVGQAEDPGLESVVAPDSGGPELPPSSLPLVADPTTTTTAPSGPFAPRGRIVDQNGDPLGLANVVLLFAETPDGPFDWVPDGSVLMSPSNRSNPVTVSDDGVFGWGVQPGYYIVRADHHACSAMGDSSKREVETEVLEIPPGIPEIILQLDCTRPTNASLTLEAWILDGVDVPGEMIVEVECVLGNETTTTGPHAVPLNGAVEIPDLPVDSDCDVAVLSMPDGVIQDIGVFETGIPPDGNRIEIYLTTGQTPDDLIVAFGAYDDAPVPETAEARVMAECNDGSTFDTTVKINDRVLLTPVALGATCTVTLTSPGLEIDEPTQTTSVSYLPVGHDAPSEDERDNWEWGDLAFLAR